MHRTTYKAYEIIYHLLGAQWSGMVKPPNSSLVLTRTVMATLAEGEALYLARVYAQIDADIAMTLALVPKLKQKPN